MSFKAIKEWDERVYQFQYIDSNKKVNEKIGEVGSEWKPHGNVMSYKGLMRQSFLGTISMEKPHRPVQK